MAQFPPRSKSHHPLPRQRSLPLHSKFQHWHLNGCCIWSLNWSDVNKNLCRSQMSRRRSSLVSFTSPSQHLNGCCIWFLNCSDRKNLRSMKSRRRHSRLVSHTLRPRSYCQARVPPTSVSHSLSLPRQLSFRHSPTSRRQSPHYHAKNRAS